jgi:hypothetical protein
MTRPVRQPGAQPGEYQRPRTAPPIFRRVQLNEIEDQDRYYWTDDGVLYYDEECTRPTGLVIVAYEEEDDDV